jgi:UDP-GlcNAc:undecaprenyl-phosphate GlcNAc-1-phosphate transferase
MTRIMIVFAAALMLAATGTPVARRIALRLGIIDQPAERKFHQTPIPLLGGVAIYAGVIGALLFFGDLFYINQLVGIVLGATWVSFVGIWDDRWGLTPLLKLLAQLAAALVLMMSGVQVLLPIPQAVNYLVTVLWIVGITNAFNLLDNMDGLSGGVGAVSATFFVLLSAISGQYLVGSLSAAVLGACLGFLLYNFNPASIFMGDTGSLFIGFLMAALGIKLRFPSNSPTVTWMIPLLVLGVPIFDTTLVVVSRLRRGVNPFTSPGKDHVSHRLVRSGWTRREAVMVLYLVGGMLGSLAIFVSQAGVVQAYVVGGLVAVSSLYWLYRLEFAPGAPNGFGGVLDNSS